MNQDEADRRRDQLAKQGIPALDLYVKGLSFLIEEALGGGGSSAHSDASKTPGFGPSPLRQPTSYWAAEELERQTRWIERQVDSINEFMERPSGSSRSCEGCGRGAAKGWRYCPYCGTKRR